MGTEHQTLSKMWEIGLYEPSIHHIRFPNFKNLATNMTIKFEHPITAIVGPNGANKTSILRALQGCPRGNDLGNYWFGTAMDEISADDRHRFIYGRHSSTTKNTVEIIKTRIGRRNSKRSSTEIDPDLFEPSRPLVTAPDLMDRYNHTETPTDGSKTRWSTINKNVIYIDFRSQLSAFDWAFHHSTIRPTKGIPLTSLQTIKARKKKIRYNARRLSGSITNRLKSDIWHNTERIIDPVRNLLPEEMKEVEKILGRKYKSIKIVNHRYFGPAGGWTVVMKSSDYSYSEAFAGSGEFTAVMLVVKTIDAPNKSLILLDEPEVSLHPAAQTKLLEYLSDIAKTKKHQIIFATHSPELIRNLPPNAVKVLTIRGDTGKVDLPTTAVSPHVAFDAIGAKFDKPVIVVEDKLAQALVIRSIQGSPLENTVEVKYIPGGATTLWTHYLPMWSEEKRKDLLIMFDGDQTCSDPEYPDEILPKDLESKLITCLNNNDAKLPYGKEEKESIDHRIESIHKVLLWRKKYVTFLPCHTPEDLLWNFRLIDTNSDTSTSIDSERTATNDNAKDRWRSYSQEQLGLAPSGNDIFTLQKQALQRIPAGNKEFNDILSKIAAFTEGVEA